MFARSLTLAVAALAFGASVNAQCTRNATVVAGNTCDDISRTYNVPTYQLALVNNDTVNAGCTNLQISQELCLGWNGMDCQETYTVVSGDTCNGINDKFSLTSNQLYANNPQIDTATCNNLYVGEVLCVAQKTYAYPIVQLPSSSPMNAPIVSTTPSADAAQVTSSATVTPAPPAATASSIDVEYCADDDESPDCVWEEDLPYCDEQ
ncbi:hypothetical protein NCC49_006026 [Naganishia albida]|nr:hypothetical protein NCC49_006026 [Naganishia albida]